MKCSLNNIIAKSVAPLYGKQIIYLLLMCAFCLLYSANVSVSDSPYKIEQKEAEAVVTKVPPLGKPGPVEPIGKCVAFSSHNNSILKLYFIIYSKW